MARRRGLTHEDKALWDHVARSVAPLHPQRRPALPKSSQQPDPDDAPARKGMNGSPAAPALAPEIPKIPTRARQITSASPTLPFLARPRLDSFDLAPTPAESLATQPLRMGHKTHRQMTQGKLRPEARIDLHGMTLAVAHPALIQFLMTSHARGFRLVLVITGKGRSAGPDTAPMPVRPGALRHNVPQWLRMMPLARIVLQATPAHRRHGGEGAYYVYLRKSGVRP